jgi:hypothetical protein
MSRILAVFVARGAQEISTIGKKLAFLCLKNVNLQKHNFLLYLSLFFSHLQRSKRIFLCSASLSVFSLGLIEIFKC